MQKQKISQFVIGMLALLLIGTAHAKKPVWTFAPVAGYPPSVTLSTASTATIKYTVTNQSHKTHRLTMRPITGVTPSGCASPLGYNQSCTLTLAVNGSGLKGDVLGGPVLCDHGNRNQCYQPSQANSLAIRLTQTPPVQQYTITPSAGADGTISPSSIQTVNSGATLTFTATPDSGYGVNEWKVDGTVVQIGGTTYVLANITSNHTVEVSFGTVTLTPSVATLALSVNCPTSSSCTTKNDALTGLARKITITNNGSLAATNVVVTPSGLPSDATVAPLSCGTIAGGGGTCVITVTPGATASTNASNVLCTTGVAPEGEVLVTADGGLSTSVATYVLSYGCIYQGGLVYSVDDTTQDDLSIGGNVVDVRDDTTNQLNLPWDSSDDCVNNAICTDVPSATNTLNGSGNTAAIVTALTGKSGVTATNYPAGYCTGYTIDSTGASPCTTPSSPTCYKNWYSPAICEVGPSGLAGSGAGAICPSSTQNLYSQLFLNGLGQFASNDYWGSTQSSAGDAWLRGFFDGGQDSGGKYNSIGVRCVRALTP